MNGNIRPHGGRFTQCIADHQRGTVLMEQAADMPFVVLSERALCDVEMIGIGAYSPLDGFMGEADFRRVCNEMKLSDGTLWPIPITCSVDAKTASRLEIGSNIALRADSGNPVAVLTLNEKYAHDRQSEAMQVYQTDSAEHPGVAVVMQQGEVCLGGPIEVLPLRADREFQEYRFTPAQTRQEFQDRGWRSVVAFQTRNPIHRAHEYLTKCALEICDGLFVHPLVGQTQAGDIPADVRMKCYQVLIEKYYQSERTLLGVMPAAMRYAGPREAILHAIVRQNYGCTHFIVGRDHAGVGNYYGTYDAQQIFDTLEPDALAIVPLKFEHASWCNRCESMVSGKTCPHPAEDKVFLSGTKVRQMLSEGKRPPVEFTRAEVADLLIQSMRDAGSPCTSH